MSPSASLLIGLTVVVGVLAGVVAFALLRFAEAARRARTGLQEGGAETAFMAAAVEQAVNRLREQERAMKARAEASERLSGEIVASLTSGLLVVAEQGDVRTLNPAGHRLLGLPAGEASGPYRDLLAGSAPLADVIGECLATRHPIVRRTLPMTSAPSGGASHLGVTVSPITNEQGHPHGAICLFTDLSTVAELEEQLRLKDSLARLGELTAGIAHEFRNGLATIHGYARLLDLDQLPQGFRPYVAGIRQETEALRQVVTNFLNFARPAKLTLASVDIGAVVERAVEEIRHEAQQRGGSVRAVGEFTTIQGDEVLLRQAFSNLCRNALEACAEAHVVPAIEIRGAIDHGQGALRVTVTDNGPGIDPAAAERLFRPFFTTRAGGTGLGLALVQKIIVTHNGWVSAGRAPGGGASLQVMLPLPHA
jgi:nitrogen fixation/metabolism regulation signal transduction histidine kinase